MDRWLILAAVVLFAVHLTGALQSAKIVFWLLTRNTVFNSELPEWRDHEVGNKEILAKVLVEIPEASIVFLPTSALGHHANLANELSYYGFPRPVIMVSDAHMQVECDYEQYTFREIANGWLMDPLCVDTDTNR